MAARAGLPACFPAATLTACLHTPAGARRDPLLPLPPLSLLQQAQPASERSAPGGGSLRATEAALRGCTRPMPFAALLSLLFTLCCCIIPLLAAPRPSCSALLSYHCFSVLRNYQNDSRFQRLTCRSLSVTGLQRQTEQPPGAASRCRRRCLPLTSGRYPRPLKEARTAALPRDRAPRPANPITDCAPEAPPGK